MGAIHFTLKVVGRTPNCKQAEKPFLFGVWVGFFVLFLYSNEKIRADFWEGDATKHFSVKKRIFSEKGEGNSVNQGFGKDLYRKGNSVKRFGPFTEPPDSAN